MIAHVTSIGGRASCIKPPKLTSISLGDSGPSRLDSFLDNLEKIRPRSCLLLGHFSEVDDVPTRQLSWIVVELVASDVRENPLLISPIFLNQLVHQLNGIGILAMRVKDEADAENVASSERLSRICLEGDGGVLQPEW